MWWGGLNTWTMVTIFPAFILKPHNSDFPCMSLVPFKLLSLCWSLGSMFASEWVCVWVSQCMSPLRGHPCFQQPSISPRWNPQLDIVGTPFSGTGALGWESSVRLQPLIPQEGPLCLRYTSRFSTTIHGCGTSLFWIFAPLPVLTYLLYFFNNKSSVQLVLRCFQVDCSIV